MSLLNIVEIDTGLDNILNKVIIEELNKQQSWQFNYDYTNGHYGMLPPEYSDGGMILISYSKTQSDYLNRHNSNLNVIASLMFNFILKKQQEYKFINPIVHRYLWNYNNNSSCGLMHDDVHPNLEGNFCSIVYYLNTCDGPTSIEGVEIEPVAGKAILFNSRIPHIGYGPKKVKQKFSLNIIFQYDNLEIL